VKAAITRSTPHEALPEQLTVEEYAMAAGISRYLAYELMRRGNVPSKRNGRILRVAKTALLIYTPHTHTTICDDQVKAALRGQPPQLLQQLTNTAHPSIS
jgi:hypothetical protein